MDAENFNERTLKEELKALGFVESDRSGALSNGRTTLTSHDLINATANFSVRRGAIEVIFAVGFRQGSDAKRDEVKKFLHQFTA